MARSDLELLEEVLDQELDDETRETFTGWQTLLREGRIPSLSKLRREWLEGVADRRGVDTGGAENLVSSGKVKVTAKDRAGLADMYASMGPKVLKPPGRR